MTDRLFTSDDNPWAGFASTDIELVLDGEIRAVTGRGAAALPASKLHVLTTWNPHGLPAPIEANLRGMLEHQRAVRSEHAWFGLGRSPDGTWVEASVALAGLSREEAVQRGTASAQLAIFELVDRYLRVISCADGTVTFQRPRRRPGADIEELDGLKLLTFVRSDAIAYDKSRHTIRQERSLYLERQPPSWSGRYASVPCVDCGSTDYVAYDERGTPSARNRYSICSGCKRHYGGIRMAHGIDRASMIAAWQYDRSVAPARPTPRPRRSAAQARRPSKSAALRKARSSLKSAKATFDLVSAKAVADPCPSCGCDVRVGGRPHRPGSLSCRFREASRHLESGWWVQRSELSEDDRSLGQAWPEGHRGRAVTRLYRGTTSRGYGSSTAEVLEPIISGEPAAITMARARIVMIEGSLSAADAIESIVAIDRPKA